MTTQGPPDNEILTDIDQDKHLAEHPSPASQGSTQPESQPQVVEQREDQYMQDDLLKSRNQELISFLKNEQERSRNAIQCMVQFQDEMRKLQELEKELERRWETHAAAQRDQMAAQTAERNAQFRAMLDRMELKMDPDRKAYGHRLTRINADNDREMAANDARWTRKTKHDERRRPSRHADNPLPATPDRIRQQRHRSSSAKTSGFMSELRKKRLTNGSGAPVLVAKNEGSEHPGNDSSSSGESSETEKDSDDGMYLDDSDPPHAQPGASEQREKFDTEEFNVESGAGESDTDDSEVADNSKKKTRHQHRRGSDEYSMPPTRRKSRDDVITIVETVMRIMDGKNFEVSNDRGGRRRRPRRGPKANVSEEVQHIKKKESTRDRNIFLELGREVFKEAFNVDRDDGFMEKPTADPGLVTTHSKGQLELDENALCFDMTQGHMSPWNAAVLEILVKRLKRACRQSKYKLPERPLEYFEDIIRERFKRARSSWKRGMARLTDGDILETPEEVEARILASKDAQLAKARKRERRVAKHHRRLDTVKETIDCKEQENAPDVKNWKWLESVLIELGEDGMSSEDSDTNGHIEAIYRPRIMYWRRNIEGELQLIDQEHRRLGQTQSRRGAKVAPRRRNVGNQRSDRDPMKGLPLCFYDEKWILTNSDKYVERTLKPSMRKFKWRELMIQ